MKVKWFSALLSPWHLWSLKIQNLGLVVIAEVGTKSQILFLSATEGEQSPGFWCRCGKRTDKISAESFLLYHQEIPRVCRLQGTLNGNFKIPSLALGTSLYRSHLTLWELLFLRQQKN